MVVFVCRACNYRFDLKQERTPKICPYCSRVGTVSREKNAEELVEEINKLLEETTE